MERSHAHETNHYHHDDITSQLSEKSSQPNNRRRRTTLLVTVIALHTLLWPSLFICISSGYLFASKTVDASLLIPEILIVSTAGSSLLYILLHTSTAWLSMHPLSGWTHRAIPALRALSNAFIILIIVGWLTSSAVWITATEARQVVCLPQKKNAEAEEARGWWRGGTTCDLERSELAAGIICLIASSVLSVILIVSHDPFAANLFGWSPIRPNSPTPPSLSPHPTTTDNQPTAPKKTSHTLSGLSFKCRSSSSLSTLVGSHSRSGSEASNITFLGLGISTIPTTLVKKCSLLSARPSLASIRTATTAVNGPSADNSPTDAPLAPPLIYLAPPMPSIQRNREPAEYASLQRLRGTESTVPEIEEGNTGPMPRSLLSVPPSSNPLALTAANLAASRSHLSVRSTTSSIYSRSASGDGKRLTDADTIKAFVRSPLGGMPIVEQNDGQDPAPDVYIKPLVVKKVQKFHV